MSVPGSGSGSGASTEDLIDELDVYLAAHCSDFSPPGNNANVNTNSVTGTTNTQTRQNTANMNHSGQDHFDNGAGVSSGPKRKMDGDPGDIGFLGNPSKVPKTEPKTPGSPQLMSAASPRMMSGSDNLSSVGIKTEMKSELEPDNIGAGRLMTPGTGGGNFSNSDETFLFDGGSSSGAGSTGNISTEQPVDRLLLSKTAGQHNSSSGNSSAAAKIKNALEASGLSGNLTAEDLQTLKKLNEIAKSQELNQEQKSSEASQLLKNNPNVSRLLLKLRTEKRGGVGPEQRPEPGMSGGQYHGQFPGQHNMADRDGSPSVNAVLPPSYNANYAGGHQQQQQQSGAGANNNNYGSPMGAGQPGQWTGSQDYYGHNPGHMPGHNMPGQYPGYMGPMRGPNQMFGGPPMNSMTDRMHPGMNMAPGAPRTMYIRDRQTGMLMQDYPGHMMRPGPGYGGPPPYMGPNTGYHPGHMMSRGRMMSPMISQGPGSPYNPRHGGPAPMYSDYDNNFAGGAPPAGAANFQRDFRDPGGAAGMMSNNKFPGNDFPGSNRGIPPHTTGVSQLRERLSRPGPGINNSSASGNMSGGSELANRLLHGKPQHEPPRYMDHSSSNFNNGNNIKSESDSLFDEIDYFNSDNTTSNTADQNQSSFGNYTSYDNGGESSNNGFNGQLVPGWKKSSGTNDVRQTMLRKLSMAIESNNMAVAEAFRLATEIENKAFSVANSEADYTSKIALHLAKIFSQSKGAAAPTTEAGDTCPDSTTWQDQSSSQPSNSSPDSSQSFKPESSSHFQSDTTLNCFQDNNDMGEMNGSGSSPGVVVSSESSFPTPQGTNVIPRGARRLSGKTSSSSLQPHSVDSGIGSPRSNSLYSPTTPISKTSSSPSVSLSENSPEK